MTGVLLVVVAVGFFFGMQTMMPRSTDPRGMMETVGQVSGVAGGLGLVMIAYGLIRRRR
jgi:hypothetical protein